MTDEELIEFSLEFRKGILGEYPSNYMCYAISAPLLSLLNIYGINGDLEESDLGECNHIYIRLSDGRVLDPSADQFNWCSREELPSVYLGYDKIIHKNYNENIHKAQPDTE